MCRLNRLGASANERPASALSLAMQGNCLAWDLDAEERYTTRPPGDEEPEQNYNKALMARARQAESGAPTSTDINARSLLCFDRRIPTDAVKLGDQSLASALIVRFRNALPQEGNLVPALAPLLFLFDACRCHCVSSSLPIPLARCSHHT